MAVDVLTLVTLVGVSLVGAGWIAHRLGLPPALGYLAVGMAFAPSVDATPDMPTEALSKTAELAVLPLLFFIGLELDLRTLRRVLSETAVASVLNILIPTAAVMAAAFLWGWGTTEALVLGLAVSLSSTIFGERLSGSAGFPREIRQRVLGILIAEDVAAGAILALLAVLGGVGEGLGGLAYS
ncbi:MAG TPA: cation:proton antiporter, partial [Candidatus Thermoplasmatota archaeon]|nr:cation:proton antiporter [Candidatus Thermoplasmatota archaeon]